MKTDLHSFIEKAPKAELHLHIEGTLEPEMIFRLAKKNGIPLKWQSPESLHQAYRFTDLQSFLNLYYQGVSVLQKEQDYYDMTYAYFAKAKTQNVCHAEIFFDPQSHTDRGIPFENVINGIHRATEEAQKNLGISSQMILCFLRHLSPEQAMVTLEQALPYKKWIIGVGLDSSEMDHPPIKFKKVFDRAREEGFLTFAHAGEEGPPEYIWQALRDLKVSRVDHGVRCLEDTTLIKELLARNMPLTVCPLSNVKLGVFKELSDHNLKKMLNHGLFVTVNSDDPAYFDGYINENYLAVAEALSLNLKSVYQLALNSLEASILETPLRKTYKATLNEVFNQCSNA